MENKTIPLPLRTHKMLLDLQLEIEGLKEKQNLIMATHLNSIEAEGTYTLSPDLKNMIVVQPK